MRGDAQAARDRTDGIAVICAITPHSDKLRERRLRLPDIRFPLHHWLVYVEIRTSQSSLPDTLTLDWKRQNRAAHQPCPGPPINAASPRRSEHQAGTQARRASNPFCLNILP